MIYYLFISKRYNPITAIGSIHYGKNKKIKFDHLAARGVGERTEVRFLPQIPYAVPGSSSQGGRDERRGDCSHCGIRQDCRVQLGAPVREGWHGWSERKRSQRPQAFNDGIRHTGCERGGDEPQGEYKDCKVRVAERVKAGGERCHLQTFFRLAGARYKRIRKRPRVNPSPQLVELKRYQLQELANLWSAGAINLFFGDESHVCTSGYVPYGWQFDDEDVYVPSNNKERLNIFGMVSPDCKYEGFDSTDSITGQKLAEWLDDYSKTIDKVTFVVLDNASIHRKGEVAKRRDEWKERGLYIFYLPTYSPHLNIAETVWRFLKGMWLKPHHYCSKSKLHEATREILDAIGKEYVINFSHAA